MQHLTDPTRRLVLLLRLMALHSAAVGVGLVWRPAALFDGLGYAPVGEPFFPVQGGVFHVLMALGYLMAARRPDRDRALIRFAVAVKAAAAVFLLTYWFAVDRIAVVLLSGLFDGALAALIGAADASRHRPTAQGGTR